MAHIQTPNYTFSHAVVAQQQEQSYTTHPITPPASIEQQKEDQFVKQLILNEQKEQKKQFVDNYISNAAVFILSFWNKSPSSSECTSLFNNCHKSIKPIQPETFKQFLIEIVKRSRCSLPTLQLAIYYIYKLKDLIKSNSKNPKDVLSCPKKTLLTCLILSFKFLFDSNYSFKAWTKISGLTPQLLKSFELQVLIHLDHKLNIESEVFEKWVKVLEIGLQKIESLTSKQNLKRKALVESSEHSNEICVKKSKIL